MASISAKWWKYDLQFKRPAGTSRGVLNAKPSYFIELTLDGVTGRGECPIIPKLSLDDRPGFGDALTQLCEELQASGQVAFNQWSDWPAIQFGLEQCFADILRQKQGRKVWLDSPWARGECGMPINGLIWMGDSCFMAEEAERRLAEGFQCIKMKVGALDFATELAHLTDLRHAAGPDQLELRVDANGGFTSDEIGEVIDQLAQFQLHSIEQPLKPSDIQGLKALAATSPIPIALDESLIGVNTGAERDALLDEIQPQYIVIKPSLLGGLAQAEDWIQRARQRGIGYWVTSALESNWGLAWIAQWAATLPDLGGHQGFGTGSLYTNNLPPMTEVRQGEIWSLS